MPKRRTPEPSPDRLEVLRRIAQYEAEGGESFFKDVENDPPSRTLMPGDVDYMQKKPATRLRAAVARLICAAARAVIRVKYRVRVEGAENLDGVTGGAVVTSNHFSITDNVAVQIALRRARGRRKLYRVIREGNYFMPGIIGFLLKYCDTLPVSSNLHTMSQLGRAVDARLAEGSFVLIYPEQAMWWNYRRPRPYRIGAFYYAAKNGVPVIPCFTTLEGSGKTGKNGFEDMYYTVHVLPPVYPDAGLPVRAAAEKMSERNRGMCLEKYREVYGG